MKTFILWIFIFSFLKLSAENSVDAFKQPHLSAESESLFFKAIKDADLEKAEDLLKKGADINVKNKWGETPLHWSAKYNRLKSLNYLIEKKASLEVKNIDGRTALHLAALSGHFRVGQSLIENGAKLEAKDKYGNTALMMATYSDKMGFFKLLISHGANLKAFNNKNENVLGLSSALYHREIKSFILKKIEAKKALKGFAKPPIGITKPVAKK